MISYYPLVLQKPLVVRLAAYSAVWFLPALALFNVLLLLKFARARPCDRCQQGKYLLINGRAAVPLVTACVCWALHLAICQAVHNPTSATWSLRPVPFCILGFWAHAVSYLFEYWALFAERTTIFTQLHGTSKCVSFEFDRHQHRTQTTASASCVRAVAAEAVATGVPLVAVYCISLVIGNWWMLLAAVYHALYNRLLLLCGVEVHISSCSTQWPYLLLNPFCFWQLTICNSTWQKGYLTQNSCSNMCCAASSTVGNGHYRTSSSTNSSAALAPVSLTVLAGNLLFQLCGSLLLQSLLVWPGWMLLCWFWLYVMLPASAPACILDTLYIPQLVNKALAPMLEALRRDYCVSYSIPLTKGAFQPACNSEQGAEHSCCSGRFKKSFSSSGCFIRGRPSSRIVPTTLPSTSHSSPADVRDLPATADIRAAGDQRGSYALGEFKVTGRTCSYTKSNSGKSTSSSCNIVGSTGCGMALQSVSSAESSVSSAASTPRSICSTTCAEHFAGSISPTAASPTAYLFACHPTGLLSRAAFFTFAAKGPGSAVAGLRTRLAVGRELMLVPLLREFLLAMGCCEATPTTVKKHLQAGTSVAVTPGGWRESCYINTYNLVLRTRKGFIRLATEAGAALVPTLCLGEHGVVNTASNTSCCDRILNFCCAWRPVHQRVVFGRPIILMEGESLEQLHTRYVQALLSLGKDHGVTLNIVE